VVSETKELVELGEVLSSIQLGLTKVLPARPSPAASESSLPAFPNLGEGIQGVKFLGGQLKRKQCPQLLPPSPEQRQKRKAHMRLCNRIFCLILEQSKYLHPGMSPSTEKAGNEGRGLAWRE
jgi:hypothetical protein